VFFVRGGGVNSTEDPTWNAKEFQIPNEVIPRAGSVMEQAKKGGFLSAGKEPLHLYKKRIDAVGDPSPWIPVTEMRERIDCSHNDYRLVEKSE